MFAMFAEIIMRHWTIVIYIIVLFFVGYTLFLFSLLALLFLFYLLVRLIYLYLVRVWPYL